MVRKLTLSFALAVGLVSSSPFPPRPRLASARQPPPRSSRLRRSKRRNSLGRPEVLLVQFRLAGPGLVSVRLCVAARIWLGRGRRMAWLSAPGVRPPPAPPHPPAAPSPPGRPT